VDGIGRILRTVVVNVGVHMSPSLVASAIIIAFPVSGLDAAVAVVWRSLCSRHPVLSHRGWQVDISMLSPVVEMAK
jgi:hypothetical protein